MDRINPIFALATLLVNLTIKNVSQLGGAMVISAGPEAARTFAAAFTTAVNESTPEMDIEDFDLAGDLMEVWEVGTPQLRSVMFHFNAERKVSAVRTLRETMGWSIKTAKNWLDAQCREYTDDETDCINGCILHRVEPETADAVAEHLRMLSKFYPDSECYGYSEDSDAVVFPSNLDVHNVPSSVWGFGYGWGVKIQVKNSGQNKIQAIKAVRAVMGCGLKAAKNMTDEAFSRWSLKSSGDLVIYCDVDEEYTNAVKRGVTGHSTKTSRDIGITPYFHKHYGPRSDMTLSYFANQANVPYSETGFTPY